MDKDTTLVDIPQIKTTPLDPSSLEETDKMSLTAYEAGDCGDEG